MSERLAPLLLSLDSAAVAVSGGVDSMTLATLAHRLLGPDRVNMIHAVSPAPPPEATARLRRRAEAENWRISMVDSGEFVDPDYLRNPVNRCYFCKTNLYGTIARVTSQQILSGANMDDLGEYRPGLMAAREQGLRPPYVEAGIDKRAVRAIARELGLADVAELPASPCLSSRVETDIAIDPATLRAVHAIESLVVRELAPNTARRRVRHAGIVIEFDPQSLAEADADVRAALSSEIAALLPLALSQRSISFEIYRNGGAFVGRRL